ncbi:MAG: hypothetical protein D6784_01805, partial [Chloroflexi bacterium]
MFIAMVAGIYLALPMPAISQENTIRFSHPPQVTAQPLQLTLTPLAGGTIFYTTNGGIPGPAATVYSGPITITEPTVIRARLFDTGGNPVGPVYTRSYIIASYQQTIPVMSIATDWANLDALHNFPKGKGREWERPINLEYFAPGGTEAFNVAAGIRIHGNFSRLYSPKKSYRLYFRKVYGGPGRLDYPLFEDSEVHKFDKLVLRAGFQDSFLHRNIPGLSDKHHTAKYISDQVTRNLHRDMGQPAAHGTWVLLYLNGQFWGLYNLTERIDLDFFQSYS